MLDPLIALDLRLFSLINGSHGGFLDVFFGVVTWLGNGWVSFPLVALAVAVKTPRRELAGVALTAALCLTANGLFVRAVKVAVHRPRPAAYFETHDARGGPGTAPVHLVGPVLKKRSFPSGHANTAFAAAALLAFLYGGWFRLSFGPAFLVAYSRVYLGDHFPLDAAAGGLGAVLIVWLVLSLRRRKAVPG